MNMKKKYRRVLMVLFAAAISLSCARREQVPPGQIRCMEVQARETEERDLATKENTEKKWR